MTETAKPRYLGVQFLDELCLTLLLILVGLKFASVAAVLFVQATSQLDVLLHHAARTCVILSQSVQTHSRAAAGTTLPQRRFQLHASANSI